MNPVELLRRATFVLFLLVGTALCFGLLHAPAPAFQVVSCLNATVTADPTLTVCISNVMVPVNGSSPENRFNVSWRTENQVSGRVRLASGEIFEDERGGGYEGLTHYIQVNNLKPNTTYTFDIISGGETFTNGGAHWSVRLGEAVQEAIPYVVIGHVNNPDGNGADGALVFALVRDRDAQGTLGPSGLLSSRIVLEDGGNLFNINLTNARTPDFSNPYTFSPENDRVLITALGEQGRASKQFMINELAPGQAPISFNLSASGTGDAATATPTLIPPTATPTLSETPTHTATLSPTLTATPAPPTETRRPRPTQTASPVPPTETVLAESPTSVTQVALPAEPPQTGRTRVFGGIPSIQPPPPPGNNLLVYVALAIVLFVGALLLGLAAFFVTRR